MSDDLPGRPFVRVITRDDLACLVSAEVRAACEQYGVEARIELSSSGPNGADDVARCLAALGPTRADEEHRSRLAEMGRLSAGIAHELRNVMTGIRGFAQVASQRIQESAERAAPLIRLIDEESQRCLEILSNYLQFAQRSDSLPEIVDAGALVRGAAALLVHRLGIEQVTLDLVVDEDVGHVRGSANALKQVLVNLSLNAAEAMSPSGGTVRIHAHGFDGQLEIAVADSGPGMAPGVLARLFEPFFTTRPHEGGTGLGLWTSRGIVEAHGGTMTVESAVGHGTTFTIRLPSVEPAPTPAPSTPA